MTSLSKYAKIGGLTLALALASGGCNGLDGPEARPGEGPAKAVFSGRAADPWPDYALPARVTLCGRAFDLARRPVYERLEAEFLQAVSHPGQVALWRRRATEFFPYIEAELRAAGLPDDLKYLAVAESDLRPWVASPAGALGLWQFMPATARHFGLAVNDRVDQRQLPEPLLGAAAAYLKTLYRTFQDWPLALAAYNAGEGRIRQAQSNQGVRDYFELDLPRETERYVYRIAAIKIILENAAAYDLDGPAPVHGYRPLKFAERTITLTDRGGWPELARQAGCDYKTLRLLNPHLREAEQPGTYAVRVPAEAL
jgi:hypothetical protein